MQGGVVGQVGQVVRQVVGQVAIQLCSRGGDTAVGGDTARCAWTRGPLCVLLQGCHGPSSLTAAGRCHLQADILDDLLGQRQQRVTDPTQLIGGRCCALGGTRWPGRQRERT